jgi:hypothetical protein
MYKCLIIDGPRGVGKTSAISYFDKSLFYPMKFSSFEYTTSVNKEASPVRQEMLLQFLEQYPVRFPIPVFDRMIGTDIVMGKLTKRDTDYDALWALEKRWAKIAVQVVLTSRQDPTKRISRTHDRDLEVGPGGDVDDLWAEYISKTTIQTVVIEIGALSPQALCKDILKRIFTL